ncbi:MAG TPA: prolyl-tRNA synthetase associated domain-containing protein [Hellea balneolensis]|uniref:Prolyl-tRNA synthetase associated domain-containing protein n=1 Tax=Hellea balneolensis TaxID=287478 RepID=A0A7C5M1C3_9PROT|nr:prolyl-tRNA synthetase associated domain-containing protein [Hellea balneolensis]
MTKPARRTDLLALLRQLGIEQQTHDHRAVFTVDEGKDIKAKLPGGHTKNLFLKDKSGALFLICALGDTKIAINQLHKHLGCKRLSFGKPDLLLEVLGVTPGSVTFFSIINDQNHKVRLILDKRLFDHEIVNFHPLENTATTAFRSADLLTFAKHTGHEVTIMDFAAI